MNQQIIRLMILIGHYFLLIIPNPIRSNLKKKVYYYYK